LVDSDGDIKIGPETPNTPHAYDEEIAELLQRHLKPVNEVAYGST
jgi:hypothetical protein